MNIILNILMTFAVLTDPAGLKVGQKVPDLIGTDQLGNKVSLYETLKTKQVILTFYRGAWCRYCMGQFRDYQDSLELIGDKNAVIIAISPEHEDGIQKTVRASKASFSLIHDEGLKIMLDYDVISRARVDEYLKQKEETGIDNQQKFLPVPATYVIGQDGIIKYVFFDPNYKVRATVKSLLEKL